jgi:AraC-like DNA-binding protein
MTTIAAFALLSLIITVIPGPDSLLELPLSAVARQRGYDSEFAFARAFKREFAVTRGAFRRAPDLLATDPATDGGVVRRRP